MFTYTGKAAASFPASHQFLCPAEPWMMAFPVAAAAAAAVIMPHARLTRVMLLLRLHLSV
jgi:hypothetical protein